MNQASETCSARGTFALPRSAALPGAVADAADSDTSLPDRVAATFGGGAPGQQGCDGGGGVGGAGGGGRRGSETAEQQIPEYVPLLQEKQGSLSKATHRRSSSRTMTTTTATGAVDGAVGGRGGGEGGAFGPAGGGAGSGSGAAASRTGGGSGSAAPGRPVGSPPPKVLPPVPAFVAGGGVGGGGELVASPALPPPSCSSNESHQDRHHGSGPLALPVVVVNSFPPSGRTPPRLGDVGFGTALSPVRLLFCPAETGGKDSLGGYSSIYIVTI